jgi:hypothetical protein
MFYKYPINDVHIHVFDPDDLTPCIRMVEELGTSTGRFCLHAVGGPFALTQNLLCALAKLKENGRCQAFGSFHYDGDSVPDADNLLEQIRWFREAGFDGIKMLDGKPGVRLRQNLPLDAEKYDKSFAYAERTQFPILYHINDPIEFWYRDQLPAWAVEKDFYYGGGEYRISLKSIKRRSASCISIRTSTSASRTFSLFRPARPLRRAAGPVPEPVFRHYARWRCLKTSPRTSSSGGRSSANIRKNPLWHGHVFRPLARNRLLPEKGHGNARALYRL